MAVFVRSFIRPAPVSFEEAIGENKTRDQATDKRKKSAINLMESTVAILNLGVLLRVEILYIPLNRR